MSNYLNIDIPIFTSYLDIGFLYNKEPNKNNERIPVEVFSYTSIPQRCGLFSVMTEYGSQHARVPIHYLRSSENNKDETDYPLDWLQLWDSLSYYCSVNIFQYLKNRAANIILKNYKKEKVKYLFTIDWCLGANYFSGYGEMAGGHKCGHVFEGNGQYFIQPNNRVLWMDGGSWINKTLTDKPKWKVFSKEFSCENQGSRWITEPEEDYWFYNFKETDNL
jgi:hypothetical protein